MVVVWELPVTELRVGDVTTLEDHRRLLTVADVSPAKWRTGPDAWDPAVWVHWSDGTDDLIHGTQRLMVARDAAPVNIVLELSDTDVTDLMRKLWLIDRQAQNAVTRKEPVNPDAIFSLLEQIKEDLCLSDRSARFRALMEQAEAGLAREAAAKLR